MDLVKLSECSHDLIDRLADRIPKKSLEVCRSFENAGEWSELIDLISATLVKENIPVTTTEREALAAVLYMYPIPMEGYKYISNPDQTLAALTIVEH